MVTGYGSNTFGGGSSEGGLWLDGQNGVEIGIEEPRTYAGFQPVLVHLTCYT